MPPFRVIYSQAIIAKIHELHAQAKLLGIEKVFLAALRMIQDRLSQDPLDYGDPAYSLHHAKLKVRREVVRPLVVYWGVYEEKSLVFLKSVLLWPLPKP
jgi:hypothetical protein